MIRRHLQMLRRLILVAAGLLMTVATPPALSENEDAAERKRLEGTWQGFVVEGRGERPERGPIRVEQMVIKADVITARDRQMSMGEGSYSLDLSKNPRAIDAYETQGPQKGKTFLGIYALEGDTLKWCSANPGRARPTEFMTRTGSGQFLMVLKRIPR